MRSYGLLNPCWVILTLLRSANARNAQNSQMVQSAIIYQGTGYAGSVVAATGCDITYELECTAGSSVCSDARGTKTVTLSGTSSYVMRYYYTSSTDAGAYEQTLSDTCSLLGTTAAVCHATAVVTLAEISSTSINTFAVTEADLLGYAQVPITAGPAAAMRSVSSCSASPGAEVTSRAIPTSTQAPIPTSASSASASATHTGTVETGLSTGAKVGIGVGAGVGAAALLAVGGVLLFWRRKRRDPPPPYQPSMGTTYEIGRPQPHYVQEGPYEFEQPAMKHEMPVSHQVQELPGHYGSYELSANYR